MLYGYMYMRRPENLDTIYAAAGSLQLQESYLISVHVARLLMLQSSKHRHYAGLDWTVALCSCKTQVFTKATA